MSYKSLLCGLTVLSLMALSIFAKGTKSLGELSLAHGATVNNVTGLSGMTLYSNNRIKTAENGGAVISFGKSGRIELGAGADLVLQLTPGTIGGTLSSGRAVISAPAGVQVNLVTRDSAVTSAPNQASRLVIDLRNGKTDVVAKSGTAKVATGGRISVVGVIGTSGELEGLARKASLPGNKVGSRVASDPTLSLLLKTTAGNSLENFLTNRVTDTRGGFFYPSITCKDFLDNPKCIRRSPK